MENINENLNEMNEYIKSEEFKHSLKDYTPEEIEEIDKIVALQNNDMKALTFLEYFVKYQFIHDTSLIFECGEHKHIEYYETKDLKQLFEYQKFVSQPFRPEMIEELFKGWKKLKSSNAYCYKIENELLGKFVYVKIFSDGYIYRKTYIDKESINIETYITPKTLNDFINDCQRAGIELTFKEEVVKKFLN